MDIYEVVSAKQPPGFTTGIDRSGVNFLDPIDAFDVLRNGFVYRQVLQSRLGFQLFANRCSDGSRIMGIFQNTNPQTSITTTLVCTKDFLYQYNGVTNQFDQILMGGSAPIGGFGIVNNADYVSGTTYPDGLGNERFVFCSRGMSDIYFYALTAANPEPRVYSFTLDTSVPAPGIAGNQFTNPPMGTLTKATYVGWYANRLNFFMPVIANIQNPQGILYSGERTISGTGDQFNVPGSGLINFDTYEIMKGMNIISDYIVVNFQRSNWTLRKRTDPFNPYFLQKIPSVIGTDASFSAVAWDQNVRSAGKTGLLTTDGRVSLRFDNKIPRFSQDNIDQVNFDLIYGGFDRINGQILFSYLEEAGLDPSDSGTTQDSVLVFNYEEKTWAVNNQRFSVFGQALTGTFLAMNQIEDAPGFPASWARMDTTEETMNTIGISLETQKTLAGDNQGFVYEINKDFDDYFANITDITQATSAVITFDATPFAIGDRVVFEDIDGPNDANPSMSEMNGLIGTITAVTLTTATVDIDSTLFTAYDAANPTGNISKIIEFEASLSPFNPYRAQGRMCYVSHVEVLLNTNNAGVYVDIYIDEEDAPFKTVLLDPSSDTRKAREWITFTVDQEANFITFVLRNDLWKTQILITSMRIHCSMGPFTSS